ncbi:CopD family protein [Roseovarius sp. THAF27]|uniref:CopD family protein n=1 Tax=Roseovarius sp. THAF27 TaxID=2587850 RepID=UPI0020C749BF|nr:CopD family protein [Roseovarius sp. THAF27]
MLARHDLAVVADDYRIIRHATRMTYTMIVTPSAVLTVIAGTWLIFLCEVFVPWLYAKLALVALLVAVHAWIGHVLVKVAEKPGRERCFGSTPSPMTGNGCSFTATPVSLPPIGWRCPWGGPSSCG